MGRNKLKKFEENESFKHFFQPSKDELFSGFDLKGKWNHHYFKNSNPLILELGCGKGDYVIALSKKNKNKNYIGIDKKGARMWTGARYCLENNIENVAFLRIFTENIDLAFGKNEIDEIWITFPEPQPKESKSKKRFTSPQFLNRYKEILKPDGLIHLKTDNADFYNYTLKVIEEENYNILYKTDDLYSQSEENLVDLFEIQTHYEKIWLNKGLKIKYIKFKLN